MYNKQTEHKYPENSNIFLVYFIGWMGCGGYVEY